MMLAPVRDNEVLRPEEFRRLPEETQERIKTDTEELHKQLEAILQQIPKWEREVRNQLRQLGRDLTTAAVRHLIDDIRNAYRDLPAVLEHLDAIKRDLIETADQFVAGPTPQAVGGGQALSQDGDRFRRYWLNLLIDHSTTTGAPVVYEDHPTFQNLLGRIEHVAQFGTLVTDFNLIKPARGLVLFAHGSGSGMRLGVTSHYPLKYPCSCLST